MRNESDWKPTKYVFVRDTLRASRDNTEVTASSRLTADITAQLYASKLPKFAKGRLLDLGCGKVPLYAVYQNLVAEVVCVDWSNSEHESSHLDFECDLSKKLPFASDYFDTIILSDVLEHIFNPELLWQEMYRIMAPGGRLILNVPFFYWLHEQPNDYYRYTEFALTKFAQQTGFKLVEIEATGGSPEVFAELMTKHTQQIRFIGKFLTAMFQQLVRLFVSTSVGKKVSRKTSEIIPLGYFMVVEKNDTAL